VSVLPQAQTSPEEPTMAELDRPDAVASGMQAFPSNFESSLLEVDPGLPIGPTSAGKVASGAGVPPGGFIPLPVGGGPGVPINNGCVPKPDQPCQNPPPPPPPPPPAVPEPGTIVLVASGAAAIAACARKKSRS
jgi:PEP-CTERM motif